MRSKKALFLLIVAVAALFPFARIFKNAGFIYHGINDGGILVSRVIDGDTIELSNGERVRYIGIDTPELREKESSRWAYKPRPYAEKAMEFNRKLVENKSVRLEFDVQKRDKYNRLLAYVYAEDGMVNLEMVRQGFATVYTYPPNVKYAEKFLEAQQDARQNNRGLWSYLEEDIIKSSMAGENTGLIKMVETEVLNTYISEKVLILNCRDNFKIVIFRNNFSLFPKESIRSPDGYFKHKTIRVHGVIKKYKGSNEIIVNDPSHVEILDYSLP